MLDVLHVDDYALRECESISGRASEPEAEDGWHGRVIKAMRISQAFVPRTDCGLHIIQLLGHSSSHKSLRLQLACFKYMSTMISWMVTPTVLGVTSQAIPVRSW